MTDSDDSPQTPSPTNQSSADARELTVSLHAFEQKVVVYAAQYIDGVSPTETDDGVTIPSITPRQTQALITELTAMHRKAHSDDDPFTAQHCETAAHKLKVTQAPTATQDHTKDTD